MASPVIGLPKIATVKDILSVLKTSHNGFPIVSHSSGASLSETAPPQDGGASREAPSEAAGDSEATDETGPPEPAPPQSVELGGGELIHGMILRRQLHALLKSRVWTTQHLDEVPTRTQEDFLTSFITQKAHAKAIDGREFLRKDAELDAKIDLRPFIDTAPYMANTLMPLPRVYRLFNEMGVRHVPVLEERQLVGIITRKDVMPETIAARLQLGDGHLAAPPSFTSGSRRHDDSSAAPPSDGEANPGSEPAHSVAKV
jgi:CBS domain-containing protein